MDTTKNMPTELYSRMRSGTRYPRKLMRYVQARDSGAGQADAAAIADVSARQGRRWDNAPELLEAARASLADSGWHRTPAPARGSGQPDTDSGPKRTPDTGTDAEVMTGRAPPDNGEPGRSPEADSAAGVVYATHAAERVRYCGAHPDRERGPCKAWAGAGTDHPGIGRCRHHAGRPPVSGKASALKRRYGTAIADLANDLDPLDVAPELAAARDALRRSLDAGKCPECGQGDEARTLRAVDVISKAVKRVEDVRASNAISRGDLMRFMTHLQRTLLAYCTEEQAADIVRKLRMFRL